ncbi:MAG: hypothetical protein WD770_00685 [Actinomycetota bacterium]
MALFSFNRHAGTVQDAPVHDPAREHEIEHREVEHREVEHQGEHHTERLAPVTRHVAAPGAYEVRPAIGSLVSRIGLSLVGGGLMVLATFLAWYADAFSINGTQLSNRVFDPMSDTNELTAAGFLSSAGLVVLILGGLALLGMAFRSGWLTRIAGALGVIAFGLYAVRAYRAVGAPFWADLGLGAWLLLAGSVLALIGGFMGTARQVIVPEETTIVTDGPTTTWAQSA